MTQILRSLLTPAMEEASDGKANEETEKVFYGLLKDLNQLDRAVSWEDHEQWEIRVERTEHNAGKGGLRVRKTTFSDGRVEYVLTTKVKLVNAKAEDHANTEVPIPTTEDNFKQFQMLADYGMIKRRYNFSIEGSDLVWEVDVFPRSDKTPENASHGQWCKIDLEIEPGVTIPAMPIEFAQLIGNEGSRSEEEEELVRWLYETEFFTKNPYAQKS